MIASCMNDRARRASGEHALSSRLASEWTENQADIYTLDERDLTAIWIATQKANGKTNEQIIAQYEELTGSYSLTLGEQTFEVVNLYAATAVNAGRDSRALAILGRDMQRSGNALGNFHIRPHNGRNYIVFKGNHRLRQVIRGTRYSLSNPMIIKMGIGADGLKGAAKGGVYVTLVVSVGVNSYAWIFEVSFGWQDFLSNLSADMVKAAIAIAFGYFTAKKTAAFTGMVVIANTAGFLVGLFTGVAIAGVAWTDVTQFAEKAALTHRRAVESLSNPSAYIAAQKRRINDLAYCSIDAAGSVVVSAVQRKVEDNVSGFLRNLSPLNIR